MPIETVDTHCTAGYTNTHIRIHVVEMGTKKLTKTTLRYLLGVCVPSTKQNAAKIRVQQPDFDEHILMYFHKYEFVYAHDPEKRCKTGDTVLIQNLPHQLTRLITHKVVDIVFPLGDITDPITGKKVAAGKYRDDIEKDSELYGPLDSRFKYDESSPRGVLEGKRDFSDKSTYVKYNEDPNDTDPYAVYPK